MTHSFRGRLALRFGATMLVLALIGSLLGYLALRRILYTQLDRGLLRLAEIEAAGTADSKDESVHFHEELFVNPSHGEASLTRFAQVWTRDREPVLRTRNLEGRDLPLPDGAIEHVAATGEPQIFEFKWDGSDYRGLVYPLSSIGAQHRIHFLEVAAPLGQVQTVLGHFLRALAILVVLGALLAAGFGWWLAGHAVRPVMEIIRQAESLDVREPAHRITAEAETDELRRLVSVLNSMLARIDTAFEHQRSFLADAGHEIKTPLTILRGDVEVALRRARSPEEYMAVLQQTLKDLRDVSTLADDLITLARSDSGVLEPRLEPVPVATLVRKATDRFRKAAESAGVQLEEQLPETLAVLGDRALLERALSNLVDNAIKYGGDGGRVTLSATVADGRVVLSVADNGAGIPEGEQGQLLERFYRGEAGRRSTRGSGLGLAIVSAIIDSHGGELELESQPGAGTTVRLILPAADAPGNQNPRGAGSELGAGRPL